MSNSYHYIDADYTYIDAQTGVLKNLLGIDEASVLEFAESGAVTKRLHELYNNPIPIQSIESLFEIHRYLFQDIYEWAGEKRKVEISKNGTPFFPTHLFEKAFIYINSLLDEYKRTPKKDLAKLARILAEILDNINHLHPFREGNGRTQREFLRLLALQKGLILNLNPINDDSVYERYMNGTINGNIELLFELIFELLNKGK